MKLNDLFTVIINQIRIAGCTQFAAFRCELGNEWSHLFVCVLSLFTVFQHKRLSDIARAGSQTKGR